MAYTFAADSDKLTDLATALGTGDSGISGNVSSEIDTTFTNIGSFGEDWSGDSYNQFVSGCEAYKGALNTIPAVLGCFATAFTDAAGGVEGLLSEVKSALDEISS